MLWTWFFSEMSDRQQMRSTFGWIDMLQEREQSASVP
jgi:hypothetical protein